MNYQSIKWMIESLIQSYECPECSYWIEDNSIEIIWAAWSTINMDILCINCWKHSIVKSEVLSIDLTKQNISPENLEKLKNTLLKTNWKQKINQVTIKDEEIVGLNKNLNKNWLNVSELLWNK